MNKKSIEDKFSSELDAYFKGIEGTNESEQKEYNELLELGKTLADKDFSENSNKKTVFNKTIKNINKGEKIMKKSNKKRFATTAASLAAIGIISVSFMKTSYAQDLVEKIKKSISIGHVTVIQVENSSTEEPVPDELKGKIFDENGKAIEVFSEEYDGKIYTADGEEISNIEDGEIITVSQQKEIEQDETLVIKDANELNNYTCFNVILPSYLPEGYKFDRAEFSKGENGNVFDSFTGLFFINEKTGKYIVIHQRDIEKAGGYVTGAEDKVEAIKINGADGILYDDRNLDWETNNILYSLSGRGEITKDELIKIAESIK